MARGVRPHEVALHGRAFLQALNRVHKHREEDHDNDDENMVRPERTSFIRRILSAYYTCLHSIRWGLLAACLIGLGVSTYFASTLTLPISSDVRLLKDSHPFEMTYLWRNKLLYETLNKEGGSRAHVVWGILPADTGDHST